MRPDAKGERRPRRSGVSFLWALSASRSGSLLAGLFDRALSVWMTHWLRRRWPVRYSPSGRIASAGRRPPSRPADCLRRLRYGLRNEAATGAGAFPAARGRLDRHRALSRRRQTMPEAMRVKTGTGRTGRHVRIVGIMRLAMRVSVLNIMNAKQRPRTRVVSVRCSRASVVEGCRHPSGEFARIWRLIGE